MKALPLTLAFIPRTTKLMMGVAAYAVVVFLLFIFYYRTVQNYTLTDSFYSIFLGFATDTSWSDGFKESDFSKVTIGMTQQEVQSILGNPVSKPNERYWGYTMSPSGTHYHERGVVFSSSGEVTNLVKGFYFD